MATPLPNPIDPYLLPAAFRTAWEDYVAQARDRAGFEVVDTALIRDFFCQLKANWLDDAILSLQVALSTELNPMRVRRSVLEFGAVGDGAAGTDNSTAFTQALTTVAAAGGGDVIVPPSASGFLVEGGLEIPAGVVLRGFGPRRSIIHGRAAAGEHVLRLATGTHHGGIEGVQIIGDIGNKLGRAIQLDEVQFAFVRDVWVWYYERGIGFADGVQYTGYVHVRDFECNECLVGVRAGQYTNACSLRHGRIYSSLDSGNGIGLDIEDVSAFTVDDVTIEPADTCLRIRGTVVADIGTLYLEPGDGFATDVVLEADSVVRGGPTVLSANATRQLTAGLEEIVDWASQDALFFGARRHHATAAAQNLVENGDLRRANGIVVPGMFTNGTPTVTANLVDAFTAGRSMTVQQAVAANDGLAFAFIAPDGVDYVTACVRYKNLTSAGVQVIAQSGGNSANWADQIDADAGASWRIATVTVAVDPAAGGECSIAIAADTTEAGGQVRVDEFWAVAGRVAAPTREHGHRIEMLAEPVLSIVDRNAIVAAETFTPVDLTALTGLAQPPRGAIGAVLRLRGFVTSTAGAGMVLTNEVPRPYIDVPGVIDAELPLILDSVTMDRDVFLRGMTLEGGLNASGAVDATSYDIDLLGWILPS